MNKSPFSTIPVAKVRDYWNGRPCNIGHSPKEIGTEEYFNEVEARKYFVEPHIPDFAEFPRWKGTKILEIGCGIGTDTINFARYGARITAVDLSDKSLEIATQRADLFGLSDSIAFYLGDAEHLDSFVPQASYDLLYSFGAVHHTPRPELALAQMRRFARPGTILKIMLYHRHSWKAFSILLSRGRGHFWRFRELLARHSEAQIGSPVTHAYTRREAKRLVEKAGFQVQSLETHHIFPYKVEQYRTYDYVKLWYFRYMPRPLFRLMEQALGWHLCITAQVPQ